MSDPISPLPTPPVRTDARTDFSPKADAFLAALPGFAAQANALAEFVNQRATDADEHAQDAIKASDDAALERAECFQYMQAAEVAAGQAKGSALSASDSASAAAGSASAANVDRLAAEAAKGEAVASRDEARSWAEQARETVVADSIDDEALTDYQVRSAMDASRGHFRGVVVDSDAAVGVLDFAQIVASDDAVTVTLPSSPQAGQMVMVGNLTARLDHRIVVTKVNGRATDGHLVLNKPFAIVTLKFISADYGWSIL